MKQDVITISQSELDRAIKERTEYLEKVKKPEIYRDNLDQLTIRMARKKELGTWTKQESENYKIEYEHCLNLIKAEEAKIIPDNLNIISEEEYAKKKAEQQGVDNILQGEEKNVRSNEDDKQVF